MAVEWVLGRFVHPAFGLGLASSCVGDREMGAEFAHGVALVGAGHTACFLEGGTQLAQLVGVFDLGWTLKTRSLLTITMQLLLLDAAGVHPSVTFQRGALFRRHVVCAWLSLLLGGWVEYLFVGFRATFRILVGGELRFRREA